MKLVLPMLILLLAAPLAGAMKYEVFVSDAGNFKDPPWQILRFDADGGNPAVFISDNLNWPQDILFLEDGTVLISNLGSGRITRHDAATGEFINDFATSIAGPTRMKVGPDSKLYVLQWRGDGMVRRYDLSGKLLGDFTSVGVPQSIGLDWDSAGNLYVSSYTKDYVRKFDPSGKDLGVFIGSNLEGPTNIWFDGGGNLLVSDYDGTAVKQFDSSGKYLGDFIHDVSKTEGICHLPDGTMLIGNGGTGTVKLFDADGKYLRDLAPKGAGKLLTPNAIVIRELQEKVTEK